MGNYSFGGNVIVVVLGWVEEIGVWEERGEVARVGEEVGEGWVQEGETFGELDGEGAVREGEAVVLEGCDVGFQVTAVDWRGGTQNVYFTKNLFWDFVHLYQIFKWN